MERVIKIHKCDTCGETDLENFYKGTKNICKACKSEKGKQRWIAQKDPDYQKRGIKQYKCLTCGEEDETKFNSNSRLKSVCSSCRYKRRKNALINDEDMRERAKSGRAQWRKNNVIACRLFAAKSRARKKGLPFDLTVEYIELLLHMQDNKCAYSGREFDNDSTKMDSMSIDQIEPSKGYTMGNVELVTSYVNVMKFDRSRTEFLEVVKNINQYLGLCE